MSRMSLNSPFVDRFDHPLVRAVKYLLLLLLLIAVSASGNSTAHAETRTISLGELNGPNGYRLAGRSNGDQAGRSLKNAGDVNGDGLDDFIIGASSANPGGVQGIGEAYLIFGSVTNPADQPLDELNGSNGFRLVGESYNDAVGEAVSGAGDVNRDGYDDLIIGAPGLDSGSVLESGGAYVVFGAPSFPATVELANLNGVKGFRINGIIADDRAGSSVGAAGDINGDGFDDVVVGAPNATAGGKPEAGQAYVIFGRRTFSAGVNASALNGSNGFRVNGSAEEGFAGNAVGTAGDFNGDGMGDLLIAAWKLSNGAAVESGAVFIIFGRSGFTADVNLSAINGANGTKLQGIARGDAAGRSVSAAGDVNGDGRSDIIIGAPFASDKKGEAYVVFGQPVFPASFGLNSLNGGNGFRLVGSAPNGEAGTAVGAADVNGDGFEDLLVGASGAGSGSLRFAGESYVVFGRANFSASVSLGALDTSDGIYFTGAAGGDQSGQAISLAGDINGDGFDEFLIGAPNAGPGLNSDAGYAYLIQGGPTLGVPMPVTHSGTPGNDTMAGSAAGDVMHGNRGNDQVSGLGGDDALKGGAGNDILTGGPGGDRLIGGNGTDTVSYNGSPSGVSVNLATGVASGGDAAGDRLFSVEWLAGSAHSDILTGNSGDNRIHGAGGNDMLAGGGGNDTFALGPQGGHDTVSDFAAGPESDDVLDFSLLESIKSTADLTIQVQGADALITWPGGDSIKLVKVAPAALHADDFRFAGVPLAKQDQYVTPMNEILNVPAPGVLANDDNPTYTPLTAVSVAMPQHGAVTLRADGSFTYAPAAGFAGEDRFTYRANNGELSNVASVIITVNPGAPAATDDNYSVPLGQELIVSPPGVLGNDHNPGSAPMTAVLMDEPVNGSLVLNPDGSFNYKPEVDFAADDAFTYRADNGLVSNIATVSIAIYDPESPPVAENDTYVGLVNKPLEVGAPGVLGNDFNPLPGAMTAELVTPPKSGTVSLKADGSFTYMPKSGFLGADSFIYRANNGKPSNDATVSLTVTRSGYKIHFPAIVGE